MALVLRMACFGLLVCSWLQGSDFSGIWLQDNDRCAPAPKNKSAVYRMAVEMDGKVLRIHIISNNGRGERQLNLTYEIGGNELVYKGMDGDENHTKVHWDGDVLVFETEEHERGKVIPSKETWRLIDSGESLERIKTTGDGDEPAKASYILDRAAG